MLFFLRAWRLRPQHDAVNVEVDDLIFLYGDSAYEEARRRRAQANDLSAARHWGAVKSEIGRRIIEVCGATGDLDALEARLNPGDAFACTIWDPPAQNRAEARRLAATIEIAHDAAGDRDEAGRMAVTVARRPNILPLRGRRIDALLHWKDRGRTHEVPCDA